METNISQTALCQRQFTWISLRRMFYLVTPKETSYANQVPDFYDEVCRHISFYVFFSPYVLFQILTNGFHLGTWMDGRFTDSRVCVSGRFLLVVDKN
jgi:hypothetical protein